LARSSSRSSPRNESVPGWLSRDPIGERGGLNLYGFVGNDGVNRWDYLGYAVIMDDSSPLIDMDNRGPIITSPRAPKPIPRQRFKKWVQPSYQVLPDGCINYLIDADFEWFQDEGKLCDAGDKGPGIVKKFDRVDVVTQMPGPQGAFWFIEMKLDLEIQGCYKDVKIRWWTCRRRLGREAGYIRECNDGNSCSIGNVYSFGILYNTQGTWTSGPYFTRTTVRYLSCENGVWVRKEKQVGVGYVFEDGTWVPNETEE